MKFTIRKVETGYITVDYEDGAWARIPISKDMDKHGVHSVIKGHMSIPEFNLATEVPYKEGETADTEDVVEKTNTPEDLDIPWVMAREQSYPNIGDQLDAAYWARSGDETSQKALDAEIKAIKEKFPKGSGPYKKADL